MNYLVKDLERAKNFYQDLFGFKFHYYETKFGEKWYYCTLPVGKVSFVLLEVPEDVFKPSTGVLTLPVIEIEKVKTYLESKDIECSDMIEVSDTQLVFRMKDSDGNYVNIMEDKGF